MQNLKIHAQINSIRGKLISVFSLVSSWFSKNNDLLNYNPTYRGWTICEIIEHISLTNYYLLILIEKGTKKALINSSKLSLENELKDYNFLSHQLEEVGEYKSFSWIRPEHMEPKGNISLEELAIKLNSQLKECLACLDKLPNGEGILYKTTMTVNSLGKLDVYQYIYFLAMHIQRHLEQMQRIEEEYLTKNLV